MLLHEMGPRGPTNKILNKLDKMTFLWHKSNQYITLDKKQSFSIRMSSVNVAISALRIWSHLLKKSLMENLFIVQCYLTRKSFKLHVSSERDTSHNRGSLWLGLRRTKINWSQIYNFFWIRSTSGKIMISSVSWHGNGKIQSELSDNFQVKLVAKKIALGFHGIQFMHVRVNRKNTWE